jgi:8-oxoguanine deaminase
MLRLSGATAIVIDATTEASGELLLDGAQVAVAGTDGATSRDMSGVTSLDVSGCVITPGLVNAHHHLLQSAFRTLQGTRGVPMAEWLPAMAGAYARVGIDPELVAISTRIGVAEGLLSGVTTVADHMLNWAGAPLVESVRIAISIAEAARSLGGRLVFVRGSARDDPEMAASSAEAIVNNVLRRAHGGVSDDGMLQLAVGPAGVHSDSRETFELLGEVAARHGLRRRTQANEQVDVAIALEKYGRLSAAGVTGTHAPGCDVPMGWGIAAVAALRDAGIVLGLGTSGGGSNDAGHLLADARLAMQVSGLVGPQLPAREVLAMATAGSAAGLGRAELGHLRPGAAADVCVWDVSGVADAGVTDPVAGLLWAAPGRRPRHVLVGGEFVVRDYELVHAEEHELVARLNERLARTPVV